MPSEIRRLFRGESRESLSIYKSGTGTQCILAKTALDYERDVVVVLPDARYLKEFASLASFTAGDDSRGSSFWDRQWIVFPPFDPRREEGSVEDWAARWSCLFQLKEGRQPKGIVLTLDSFLPYWPPWRILDEEFFFLMQGEECPPERLMEKCVCWGYERVSQTSRVGQFSARGDILDIFPPGYDLPLRLEYFGDSLESIRLFQPVSQRSSSELNEAVILPVAPAMLQSGYIQSAEQVWDHLWTTGRLSKQAVSGLKEKALNGEGDIPPGLFYPDPATIADWLPSGALTFLVNPGRVRSGLEEMESAWKERLEEESASLGRNLPADCVLQSQTRARQDLLSGGPQLLFEELPLGDREQGLELQEKRYHSFTDIFWRPQERKRPLSALSSALEQWRETRHQVVLLFHSEHSRHRFFRFMEGSELTFKTRYKPEQSGIYALISDFGAGLDLAWKQSLILSEDVLQPSGQREGATRKKDTDFQGLERLDEIEPEDLLVHRDYGVGQFAGLTRLQVEDTGNDYLVLVYAGGDKLYVPVDRLNLVQKYKGPEGVTPSLDKLGSNRWAKTKERVRKALETVAHDLVQVYAYRTVAKGFDYPAEDELYREFEATFPFEETLDQEKAITEVEGDMERPEPMDRLVCGDSGFGKTEVAMRAAFKAISAGKQVAMLCPTTVLAEQHYRNFKGRMEDFSVSVALMSRFIPAKKQKEILRAAERGEIDMLIGTHRLLSDDVRLPRLSLFILDEEQRFGVRHKEKLKKLRQNLDVLTLTATPIPRTLQLSVSGIRDLSVIETPPRDRKPVHTSLIERDPEEMRSILRTELDRGGQIFWVYNRINNLLRVQEFVQSLVPEARVAVAHGKMRERRLEEVMYGFWQGDYDILVSTAIVESGLDFPRANTLVVDQAQMFGLGQLYQLRGRVGRSMEQAYAYFVVPSVDKLPVSARKRLQTVLDLDYLGAGFQVALEDMRLRGAGNILGEAQSGNISRVGLELFLEMLEQEVKRVKGDTTVRETEPELNITFEANIPASYIQEDKERLNYYKAISSSGSREELEQRREELQDRFGSLPKQTRNLFAVLGLKMVLARLQVEKADLLPNRVVLYWSSNAQPVSSQDMVQWVQRHQDRARFEPPAKLELRFAGNSSTAEEIREIEELLSGLISSANAPKEQSDAPN
ncbi:MAG: transcription-repair coupling factor [Desulfohalobiaceae bacterium]|nr:transcription-repair coupling factor [Desulfohalobiaceae bacterium]